MKKIQGSVYFAETNLTYKYLDSRVDVSIVYLYGSTLYNTNFFYWNYESIIDHVHSNLTKSIKCIAGANW